MEGPREWSPKRNLQNSTSCVYYHHNPDDTLGTGSFSTVYRAVHILSGLSVAVKVIDKESETYIDNCDIVENELSILAKLPKSVNIIEFYEKFETIDKIYMVFELFKGEELFAIVKKAKKIPEHQAAHYFYSIIKVIAQLAEMKIVHRDIKAENVLVNEMTDVVKVIDFGFSKEFEEGKMMKTAEGSPLYSAPEILAGEKFDPIKADLWSAGVLLFYMLFGRLPFYDENPSNLYSKIIFEELQLPETVNQEAAELVKSMLSTTPSRRPTIEEILYLSINIAIIPG